MATYENDDRAAPVDARTIIINGRRYFFKTNQKCNTCSQPDRYMYVSRQFDGQYVLECPMCDSTMFVYVDSIKQE